MVGWYWKLYMRETGVYIQCVHLFLANEETEKTFADFFVARAPKAEEPRRRRRRVGWDMGRGVVFLPSWLGDWALGRVLSSTSYVRIGAPTGNAFWHILKAFLHLYTDAFSSSNSDLCHIWGQGRGLGTVPYPNVELSLQISHFHTYVNKRWWYKVNFCIISFNSVHARLKYQERVKG